MSAVGIIANPASGKDIRRLVAQASVFDNNEKVNIIRRILRALDALGIRQVFIMPDTSGLGLQALDGLRLGLEVRLIEMPVYGDARDSATAARILAERGVACIITLGGDGTNRAVARGCGDVPLIPISTGTNNVFPVMVEGTVAGLAAGIIAAGLVSAETVSYRAKRLELYVDGELEDVALVDVATSRDLFIGSRALWDPGRLQEVVLAQARPGTVGLAAVGGCLATLTPRNPRGLYLRLGAGGRRVLAPVAPGLVVPVGILEYRLLEAGEEIRFNPGNYTVALDGEREIEVGLHQTVSVRLTTAGPRVVDIEAALTEATRRGAFDLVR
jgi:predicted polyphosphate/ATP-dependent NAD kinase